MGTNTSFSKTGEVSISISQPEFSITPGEAIRDIGKAVTDHVEDEMKAATSRIFADELAKEYNEALRDFKENPTSSQLENRLNTLKDNIDTWTDVYNQTDLLGDLLGKISKSGVTTIGDYSNDANFSASEAVELAVQVGSFLAEINQPVTPGNVDFALASLTATSSLSINGVSYSLTSHGTLVRSDSVLSLDLDAYSYFETIDTDNDGHDDSWSNEFSGEVESIDSFDPEALDAEASYYPIVIDLEGNGIEITYDNPTYFDWDADGFREKTSWVTPDDGFLVLDLNTDGTRGSGDGKIDQARELAFSLWGNEGDTDLQALARAFDDNNDNILNALDAVWSELKIWQDLDQDGETDEGELKTLSQWGITQINLNYDGESPTTDADTAAMYADTSNDIVVFGNTLHGLSSYVRNGEAVSGGVGDMTLSYNTLGWRRTPTAIGYSIEFESGAVQQYAVLGGSVSAMPDLVAGWLDGASGNRLTP
ncbi:hypothetical protein [Phaeobacter sp. NW0010-22]|uniref:hypothetical protein n=1 Tax=Phaeobacter sp. NW0010-22 TaxID=3135907 RepID=UPI00310655E4